VLYVAYRKRHGLSLTEVSMVELPPLTGARPVSYPAVLVAFEEGTYSETAMATALKLAAHRKGDVKVAVTVRVPAHLALDAPLQEAEALAGLVIETARQWAGRGQRVRGEVLRVRDGEAGHRIVELARETGVEAIVMPMPMRSGLPGGSQIGKTLQAVLAKRPCRVIIDSVRAEPVLPLDGHAAIEPAPEPARPIAAVRG